MLLSMTGFGEATCEGGSSRVRVSVRTVNNRYLKMNVKCDECLNGIEADVEKVLKGTLSRGTVNVSVRLTRVGAPLDYEINETVLQAYWCRLRNVQRRLRACEPVRLGDLLALPGVVGEDMPDPEAGRRDWPLVRTALEQALDGLNGMRVQEGEAMGAELADLAKAINQHLDEIEQRAPLVVEDYRARLTERLNVLLADGDLELDRSDILRELSIFAERSDIREEVVRLRSHLEQFAEMLGADGPAGRKIEFLTQEMFREANTIGSKANDVAIAHRIVDIKSSVDRMRELIQNVE